MRKYLLLTLLFVFAAKAQNKKIDKLTAPIVAEGKKLYRSEMASWYGSDIFLEKFVSKRSRIGGYFSYTEGDVSKCVFYSNETQPKTLGIISFDSTYNVDKAIVDGTERELTSYESDLRNLRELTKKEMVSDTLFVRYKDTDLNIIPLIEKDIKKVYLLTGPQKNGVMIFGNDYLLTFDKNNNLISKKRLHKSYLPVEYGNDSVSGIHSHLPSTGDFITSTDICTLMLYEKFAKWDSYYVISKEYVSIWNCKTDNLFVMTRKAWEKMNDNINKNEKKN